MRIFFLSCLSLCLFLIGGDAFGQVADTLVGGLRVAQGKTVEVSRAFSPSIQDANRVHTLPRLDDTAFRVQPFEYKLSSRPLVRGIGLRALPAARIGRESDPEYGRYFLKLGLGNYYSPLAAFHYGSGYSRGGSFSLDLDHVSSFGHRRLLRGELVRAPQSATRVDLSGTLAFASLALDGRIGYGHTYDSFYGRLDSAHASFNPLWGSETSGHRYGLGVSARSTHRDSSHFNYSVRAWFDGYADNRQMVQSHLHAEVDGHMYVRHECYGADVRFDYFHRDLASQKAPNGIFSVHPWAKLFGERWRVVVGARLVFDTNRGNTYTHVYPMAHFSYDIVRHYFIPYVEVDGGLELADYMTLMEENRWMSPGLVGWNASRRFRVRGGFRGNINARTSFDASVSYALVDSARFWVNRVVGVPSPITSPVRIYGSDFELVYDNAELVHARGELAHSVSDRYVVGVEADYWHYGLRREDAAWHRPQYRVLARASYNLRRKVYAGIYFHVAGGRKARGVDGGILDLPMEYDLSLDLRYRFTERVSTFVELRNILGAQNQVYYLYPGMRFHGHAGISLHF